MRKKKSLTHIKICLNTGLLTAVEEYEEALLMIKK